MTKSAIIGFGGAGYSAGIDVYSDTDIGPYNPMLTTYYVKGSIPYDTMFPFGSIQKYGQSWAPAFSAIPR